MKFKKILILCVIAFLAFSLTSCIEYGYGGTKASGGGVITDVDEETPGETAVFGFTVQLAEEFDGLFDEGTALIDAKGKFQLIDKKAGFRMNADSHSVEIMEESAEMVIYTNYIMFFGTAVVDGVEVVVSVGAADLTGDSMPDQVGVLVSYGEDEIYSITGEILKGNIKVS